MNDHIRWLFRFWFPDRAADESSGVALHMEVINGDDFAIGPEDGPQIADVAAAKIVTQHDRLAPRSAIVAAQSCLKLVGGLANAVNQAKSPIWQLEQRWRIAFARIGDRSGTE